MNPRTSSSTHAATTLQLSPASRSAQIWLFVLALALPLLLSGIALRVAAPQPGAPLALFVVGITALATLPLWWWVARSLRSRHARINADGIEITSSLHTRRLSLNELDLLRARVVDLDEHTELRPVRKLLGVGLPGFHSGWFLLRNRRRSFVATAGGSRVLWIPTFKGYDLLLELPQPVAALETLRAQV